ncbi:unnamed protein product [Ixodes hexagonus]
MALYPVAVTFLGVAYFGAKLIIDLASDALFPWCDHPVSCYDFRTELSQSVDPTVDVCEGLYDHTCGFWALNHPLSGHQIAHANQKVYVEILKLLSEPPKRSSSSVFDKTVTAFSECQAVADQEQEHLSVLLDVLKNYSLDWPPQTLSKEFNVLEALVGLSMDLGMSVIFGFELSIDFKTDKRYGFVLTFSNINHNSSDLRLQNVIQDLLGHELSHSFDFYLGQISKTGDDVDWYTKDSREKFRQKMECVIDQVENASDIEGIGRSSIAESFADTAGVEKAYSAYSKTVRGQGLLSYTPDQLFFLSGCFAFCAMQREAVDPEHKYPPTFLRCDVPASNEEHFAEVFKCRKRARLNPKNRCDFH